MARSLWNRRDAGATPGKEIHAKGIYRDPLRSSHNHFSAWGENTDGFS